MSRWFRLYDDAINDPKLLKLPDNMRWIWVAMLCIASKNGGVLPPVDDVALSLRVPDAKAGEYITKLVKAKLFDRTDAGFIPHNWDGRQFKSDTSKERVKRHRENKRNVTDDVACNVTSTVTDTVTVTPPEQSRAETESKQSTADACALDENGLKQQGGLVALFTATCNSLHRGKPDFKPIETWLLDGIAPATISATVTPILKRKADMASLAYCDAAVREAHAKAGAAPSVRLVSNKVWVDEGTIEWNCWQRETNGGRGSPVMDQRDADGKLTGRRGWEFPTLVPAGYDEATGEKLQGSSEENAA